MKLEDSKFHTIYAVFILLFIIGSSNIYSKLSAAAQITYNPMPIYRSSLVILLLFGTILGFDHLYNERKKEGKWNVNYIKLILLGSPSLLIIVLHWLPMVLLIIKIKILFIPLISGSMFYDFSAIMFGWVVTTSFYKTGLSGA